MKQVIIGLTLFSLVGCAQQSYQPIQSQSQAPTASEAQSQCFAKFKKFVSQADCIEKTSASYGVSSDPRIQEYLAYVGSMKEKVQRKTLSEGDARLKLTSKLSELVAQEQSQIAAQQQLEYQRNEQFRQAIMQSQQPPVQLYIPPRPVVTNCSSVGNDVRCTSQR